jgi:hypothetical protein
VRTIRNAGTDRVVDLIAPEFASGHQLDLMTASGSLFAFQALHNGSSKLSAARLLLPADAANLSLLGNTVDRVARNGLQAPALAKQFAEWIRSKVEIRCAPGSIPQGLAVLRGPDGQARRAVHGSFGLSTDGFGLTPGNPLSFIQASETTQEAELLAQWFDGQWDSLGPQPEAKTAILNALDELAAARDPMSVYATMLFHLFRADGRDMDEDRIVKSATGIRDTIVWKKLYKLAS